MDSENTSIFLRDKLQNALNIESRMTAECQDIASAIQSGQETFYEFVKELRPALTHREDNERRKGIEIFSNILAQLPKDHLNEFSIYFTTVFYCQRLKGHYSIIPAALQGILAIVQMDNLSAPLPEEILRAIFKNVHCQSLLFQERHAIYMIFKILINRRGKDFKSMEMECVYGILVAMNGERDPRNLMLLFDIIPSFLKNFPPGHLAEEMFEVLACYFPVDFKPSSTEELHITREDLAERLAPCLYATPDFADFCITLIIEKLTSNLKVAKLESLYLLHKGAEAFGLKIEEHLMELWSALRKEVMPGGDIEVKNAALRTIMKVIEVISVDDNIWKNCVEEIITSTKSSLCDVQLSLFRPAVKLLESVARVNKKSCIEVLKAIVPLCLGQYCTKTSLSDKIMLIGTLNSFMKICTNFDLSIKSVPELTWTDIPKLYLDELTVQCTELTVKLLCGLTIQKWCLSHPQRIILYEAISNEINTGCTTVRNICHDTLLAFAILYPSEVSSLLEEKLEGNISTEIHIRILEALAVVAKPRAIGTKILPKVVILAKDENNEISLAALNCLLRLVTTKNIDFDIQQFLYHHCNIFDELASISINKSNLKLSLISSIFRLTVKKLSVEEQQEIVHRYTTILNAEIFEANAVSILSLFIPLCRNIELNLNANAIQNLYNLATTKNSSDTRQLSCKLFSTLINKMDNDDLMFCDHSLIPYLKMLDNNLESDIDIVLKQATVDLQIWITKALITKGSRHSQDFLGKLTDVLRHDQIGQYLAQQYRILIDKHEDIFTEDNSCIIKMFYKQRVFEYLIHQDSKFEGPSRQNYLVALVHLLEEVPVELLFMYLAKLVPMLIESLSLDNGQLILSTLLTLKLLLDTKNDVFSDKIQYFIPRLLNLSTFKTMDVRIATLDCLTSYCNYPFVLINPYKQDVLDGLIILLDDRKRLVRKAAVKARTRWFLVGVPDESKGQ